MISVLLKFLRFILWTKIWLSWWMIHVHFKRMCILLSLDGMFKKCRLNPICWGCSWILPYLCWFCLIILLIIERGVLKSPTIIMGLSISPFYQFFLRIVALLLCAYTFGIAMSFWWIDLFNNIIYIIIVVVSFL